MPKGQLVNKNVMSLVHQLLADDETLTGNNLKGQVETQIPEVNYTVRTYQKLKEKAILRLDEIRKTLHDEQWSMGSYFNNGYRLSSEDNLAILRVRDMQLSRDDIKNSMSVRQALWISRLRSIVDYHEQELNNTPEGKYYWLWMYSFQYAIREKVAILNGDTFDSHELDNALIKGHNIFKKTYEKSVYANWTDYQRFYDSHFLKGYETKEQYENRIRKDGE